MVKPAIEYDVKDIALADEGVNRIEWAEREMPVLRLIRDHFKREQPLKNLRVAACLHVTTETANLMVPQAGGAAIALCASTLPRRRRRRSCRPL
jgi:adenosylhomocysteinase